jgi:competence protein ComEA
MLKKAETKCFKTYLLLLLACFMGLSFIFCSTPSYGEAQKTLINLNTASAKDLETIKGVGPATSKKIIEGRPYKSVEDLKKTGIPDKTIESIKPYVTVSAAPAPGKLTAETKTTPQTKTVSSAKTTETPVATKGPTKEAATPAEKAKTSSKPTAQSSAKLAPGQKININTATKEQIEALPEIGPVKAQAIIDGRPYKKAEDVMKVKGIKEGTFNKIKDSIVVQ